MTEKQRFLPEGRPLFIGSLPLKDHEEAIGEVLQRTADTPHWVQLPSNPREGFLVQFCEGLPGLETDPKVRIAIHGQGFEEELLAFYQEYLDVTEGRVGLDDSRFSLSADAAPGLYLLLERLEGLEPLVVKGQVSGPLSVSLGILDETGRCAYYDDRARDAIWKLLSLKARWQAGVLARSGRRCMVFVDEPALGSLGSSAYISISERQVLEQLGAVLRGIRETGGLAGVHVCANADWGALMGEGLDVLSFDAFSYFDKVVLFREQIAGYLRRGGILAWGIVPTDPQALEKARAEQLAGLWERQARKLAGGELGLGEILEQVLITPSCGLGSLDPDLARKAMDLTVDVSGILRGGG